jgi:hypothetical protein
MFMLHSAIQILHEVKKNFVTHIKPIECVVQKPLLTLIGGKFRVVGQNNIIRHHSFLMPILSSTKGNYTEKF